MRKLLLVLVAIVLIGSSFEIHAQSIRETYTICRGETIIFPTPKTGPGGPGACSPSLTDVRLEGDGTVLSIDADGFTLQPEPGLYTVVGKGSCSYLDPITGLSRIFNAEVRWTYEVQLSAACQEAERNDGLFNDYPWLSDLVDRNNCTTEKVELYKSSIYSYLFITAADGSAMLYDQNGNFYCQNSSNFDCPTAYNFGPPIRSATWECSVTGTNDCDDEQAIRNYSGSGFGTCNTVTSIERIDYLGNTYYKTNLGQTLSGSISRTSPCPVQENFGATYDCQGTKICESSLAAPPTNYDPELCAGLAAAERTIIWQHPDRVCDLEDPFELASIQRVLNERRYLLAGRDTCQELENITEIYHLGTRLFRVTYAVYENAPCGNFPISPTFYDCKGEERSICSNPFLCQTLSESLGTILWQNQPRPEVLLTSDLEAYDVIYSICKGDTIDIPNPDRAISCEGVPGVAFYRPTWTSNTGIGFGTFPANDQPDRRLRLFPTQTTTFEARFSEVVCGQSVVPTGQPLRYLVIVEENENCSSNNTPYFIVEACLGDTLDLPFANHPGLEDPAVCQNWPAIRDTSAVRFIEFKDKFLRVVVKQEGEFRPVRFGGRGSAEGQNIRVSIDCPSVSYIYNIILKSDCQPTTACTEEGTVFFENCDDGELYYFIRTSDGRVFDPYLGAGVSFNFERGQKVKFGYEAANFNSPCSVAEKAITVTCVELIETEGNNNAIFNDYPWLTDLVNPNNCSSEEITVYQQGIYKYLLVTVASGDTKLYNQDGLFYCQQSANYDCVAAYNLGNAIDAWECTGSGGSGCAFAEQIRLDPCDPNVIETALYEYNGTNYIVTTPDPSLIDAGPSVLNCSDGSQFCTASIFFESPECNDFFQRATKLEVLASRADCSSCSAIAVGGGLREIVITEQRNGNLNPVIPIISVQYRNKATNMGGFASDCSSGLCAAPIFIPVEFDRGNNEFEVTVTFQGGLSCQYDVRVVEIEDCICPAVYMPVCGVDGKTYGNGCEAACAGVEVAAQGECGCVCTDEYAPVCGVDGRTYSNACEAACSGVEVASIGECGNNNNAIFNDYPWLTDLVNPSNCSNEQIVVYQQGIYKYLLVTVASGDTKMYNQDGLFYCQQSANYDCVAAYGLGTAIDSWTCTDTPPGDCLTEEEVIQMRPDIQDVNCRINKIFKIEYNGSIFYDYSMGNTPGRSCTLNSTLIDIDCRGGFPCLTPNGNAVCVDPSLGIRTEIWSVDDGDCNCPQVVDPVCGSDLNIYNNACEATCAGVEVIGNGTNCGLDEPCTITITNNECRTVGVYDENDNLLTTMRPGPLALTLDPPSIWTDTRPLLLGDTRTYIFKENDFILGRRTVSCENQEITVVSTYSDACGDANPEGPVTNIGCRNIEVFSTNGNLLYTIAPEESITLDLLYSIFIYKVGADTLHISPSFSFDPLNLDSGGCGNNPAIFNDYPWLTDLIDPNNCSIGRVEVYQSGIYTYLRVQADDGFPKLYNQDGLFYCQESANYNCVAAYNLGTPIDSWTCPSGGSANCTSVVVELQNNTLVIQENPLDFFAVRPEISGFINVNFTNNDNSGGGYVDTQCTGQTCPLPLILPGGMVTTVEYSVSFNLQDGTSCSYIVEAPSPEFCNLLAAITFDPCDPTIKEVAVYEYRGRQYLVTEPAIDTDIQDLEITAVDCETGELFCAQGELASGNPDVIQCGVFLSEATKLQVVVNRERDCPDACPADDCSLTTLPNEFGLFTIIYSICEGDTLTVPNPNRSFICNNPSGPAPPIGTPPPVDVIPQVLNMRPQWESRGANDFSTSGGMISFYPTETTEFIGYWPAAQCNGGISPPNGRPVHYLVIVNNRMDCQTTENPTFLIEACVGDIVTIPSPVVPSAQTINACPGNRQFMGGTIAELAEPIFPNKKDLQVRILDEGRFQVEAMGGSGFYSTDQDRVSCPEITYNFVVRLKPDCGTACAQVVVCGVDGNLYPTPCAAAEAGIEASPDLSPCLQNMDCNFNYEGIVTVSDCDAQSSDPILLLEDGRYIAAAFSGMANFNGKAGDRLRVRMDINIREDQMVNCSVPAIIGLVRCFEVVEELACDQYTGTIFFENCDNGQLYYFVRTADGKIYDPYFDSSITYTPVDGQQLRFDFVDATFPSPCSVAEKAITITCLEVVENGGNNTVFEDYPFLDREIDRYGCNAIEVYDQGSHAFIFLRLAPNRGRLYLDNGTFYCETTPTYDCLSAYGLGVPSNDYGCSNLDNSESEERAATTSTQLNFKAFPNPTTGRLTIQLPASSTSDYQLYIHDMLGRRMYQKEVDQTATSVELDMIDYENGVYYIELKAAGIRGIQKVVKQGLE